MDTESIKAALKTVKFPGFSRDIISFGLVRDVDLKDGEALISVEITTADTKIPEQIAADIKSVSGRPRWDSGRQSPHGNFPAKKSAQSDWRSQR